jgi:CheY-like chemotaxis protein
VLADATQVHQVMMNLGTNAWHSMKERPGVLEVVLEEFEVDRMMAEAQIQLRPGFYIRVSVRDTGKGMDAATQIRIFEPFFTTKAPGEGTGLGLSVVHGIMQGHEGAVHVYSQPGEGTVFHLYFPVYRQELGVAPGQSLPVPRGNGERILFVDDEPALAELGKKVLELLGYQVRSFSSVGEAIEELRCHADDYDLVVTDQSMPKMSGIDFSRQLLLIRKDLPVILTTGYASPLTMEKLREIGIRDLLLKPLCLQSLGLAVHEVLGKRKTSNG